MPTAIKKRIKVSFERYDGHNEKDIIKFTEGTAIFQEAIGGDENGIGYRQRYTKLSILTKEGEMLISEGDFVIKEPFPTPDRKFYPCKPEIILNGYDIIQDVDVNAKIERQDELINKHLANWHEPQLSSIAHFAQTGKPNGGFLVALRAMLSEYESIQNQQA